MKFLPIRKINIKLLLKDLLTALSLSAALTGSTIAGAADKDIVDTAVVASSFKTLTAALQAADLVDALKGSGPFTVFAPTDEAFSKLPPGIVASLLKPENEKQLAAVLTFHVVTGKVTSNQVVGLQGARTLNGQRINIVVSGGTVAVDKANVVKTDIECSNGTIHVSDSEILLSVKNIFATAVKAGTFKTFMAAGLAGAMTGETELTVYAPTNEAFAQLPGGTVENLLKPENQRKLVDILKYLVVAGSVYSEAALDVKLAKTLQGSTIAVASQDGKARVKNADLIAFDIDALNVIPHVIDNVLLPPAEKKVSSVRSRQLILGAIAPGAPTYNAGHHQACVQSFITTANTLVNNDGELPPQVVAKLEHVISQAQHSTCPYDQA